MVVILFSFYLCFYILIFSKILLSENVKVDKFGFFKENSMVVQNMFLIYLFFFVMCSLYIVLYAYDFIGFINAVNYDLNFNDIWYFCWISTFLNYLFYSFCLLKKLGSYDISYKYQFYFLTFLVVVVLFEYRLCVFCFFIFLFSLEIIYIFIFYRSEKLGLTGEYPIPYTKRFRNFFKKKN